jgi:hypothetical protein
MLPVAAQHGHGFLMFASLKLAQRAALQCNLGLQNASNGHLYPATAFHKCRPRSGPHLLCGCRLESCASHSSYPDAFHICALGVIAWLPGAWQRHTPTPARRDACRVRHSAIASSICSFQPPGCQGRDDIFLVLDQVSELAAGEDQFKIGVPAELLPMAGAVEGFEPDTHFSYSSYTKLSGSWGSRIHLPLY